MALTAELREMVARSKSQYQKNNSKTSKPKEGRNTYRIIAPNPKEAKWVSPKGQWWHDLGVHWIKPSLESNKPLAVVGDAEFTFNEPSILTPVIERAIAEAPDEDSRKLYESWRSHKSVLINVINREEHDSLEVLELTPTTFGKILELIEVYDEEGKDITDATTGNDIVITRTGKGLNTEYSVMLSPKIGSPVTERQIKDAADLNAFIRQNYFRGEERKALAAIASTSGVAMPATGGAVALNSPSASVDPELVALRNRAREEALRQQETELKDAKAKIKVQEAETDESDLSLAGEIDGLEISSDSTVDLSSDESDSILEQLNKLVSD